jgi:hypothetical protein
MPCGVVPLPRMLEQQKQTAGVGRQLYHFHLRGEITMAENKIQMTCEGGLSRSPVLLSLNTSLGLCVRVTSHRQTNMNPPSTFVKNI